MELMNLAVRAYSEPAGKPNAGGQADRPGQSSWPRYVIVFDTETTTEKTQRLTFGFYRLCRWSDDGSHLECLEEGFLYADDLPKLDPEGFAQLQDYARSTDADVILGFPRTIQPLSRSEFVEDVLYRVGYEARALIVGFNLPFDLSRVAIGCGAGRRRNRGGFSLVLSGYRKGRRGRLRPNPFRPRVQIRHLDSKKAFIEFDKPHKLDPDNQRPADGMPSDPNFAFKGHFLDLRTLAYALTAKPYTLAGACEAFGVEHGKAKTEKHGVITSEYIEYARRDVLATQELLEKLRVRFDRHPIELDPCKAYSTASLAKAYSRAMGLARPRAQFDALPPEVQGRAMTAFFGGRAEARIRKTPVPVVYVDFLSMYPTVLVLMYLWDVLRAEKIEVVEATAEVQALLDRVTLDDVFRPDFWRELRGFAEVIPEGDILPARAKHNDTEWTVGVNRLTSHVPLWYGIPDLVASKLLTGKAPRVERAFLLVPKGRQRRLRPVEFGGAVSVDPRKDNIFKAVIEERQRIKRDDQLPEAERDQIRLALKIFANAGSYGVFVEMNRKDLPVKEKRKVSLYGRDGGFECRVAAPEEPGPYFFAPVAALITGGARLMLAALERCVTDAGGSYAFADTDSMAIVANRDGGLVPCEGGSHRLPPGRAAVQALSWAEVDRIVERFESLNPYDCDSVPGSILKIEDVNRDPETRERREIYAYAISAKRYALFTIDSNGHPDVLAGNAGCSEHGLGQFLNPLDPDSEDTRWIRAVWQGLIEEALGGGRFEPERLDRPAVMRTSVSTPQLAKRFERFNRKKRYAKQIKPFNFLLSITVPSIEWPRSAHECGGFHLIAPYSRNPLDWFKSPWTDLYSNREYRIRSRKGASSSAIRVQDFEDVLDRFRDHPESKSGDADGDRSDSATVGLLERLHLQVLSVLHIGKETNLLERQEEGVALCEPQTVYWSASDWGTLRPWLDRVPLAKLSKLCGIPERTLRSYRLGQRVPPQVRREAIARALAKISGEMDNSYPLLMRASAALAVSEASGQGSASRERSRPRSSATPCCAIAA